MIAHPPLAARWDEIIAEPRNALVENALAEGRKAIGYTCSFVPEPLLSLPGLLPLRLRAPDTHGTPLADTYLSSVLCPYVRSLLEHALEGRYEHLAGWVIAASCDHVRRLADNLRHLSAPPFCHVLDVPHKRGPAALEYYLGELERLAAALAESFGVDASPGALSAAIARHNEYLALLRALGELRRREHPPLSGTAFHRIMVASRMAPKDELRGPLAELVAEAADWPPIRDVRARVMVVGSQLDEPGYLEIIESMGALVVADRFCGGSLPGLEPIAEKGDPLRVLAEHSLVRTRCPRMMADFDERVRHVVEIARQYRVDGIVIEIMKFCDLWGVESAVLAQALRTAGLPVLRLEREYALGGAGPLRTRVQAFLESMGR